MTISLNGFFPLLLIFIGLGYLLFNLGLIPITPWQVFLSYWPLIIIFLGLKGLSSSLDTRRRGGFVSTTEILLAVAAILLGVYLLAPAVGWDMGFIGWSMIWPILLIVFGLSELFGRTRRSKSGKTCRKHHSAYVGEVRWGGDTWVLTDTCLRHGVGEVHLDLTKAVIPDREVTLDIMGFIGEATVYVPADLPIKVNAQVGVGELQVLDQRQDGLTRSVFVETPEYAAATRKLNLKIQWRVGEVKVRQIG